MRESRHLHCPVIYNNSIIAGMMQVAEETLFTRDFDPDTLTFEDLFGFSYIGKRILDAGDYTEYFSSSRISKFLDVFGFKYKKPRTAQEVDSMSLIAHGFNSYGSIAHLGITPDRAGNFDEAPGYKATGPKMNLYDVNFDLNCLSSEFLGQVFHRSDSNFRITAFVAALADGTKFPESYVIKGNNAQTYLFDVIESAAVFEPRRVIQSGVEFEKSDVNDGHNLFLDTTADVTDEPDDFELYFSGHVDWESHACFGSLDKGKYISF